MGGKHKKKVVKKKLIGFDADMLEALERRKNETGEDQTGVLRNLLVGKGHFNPEIERWLAEYQRVTGFSREDAVQAVIMDALELKAERGRLLKEPPKKR